MKKFLFLAFLIPSIAHARFNELRDQVGKSSFTESVDTNVRISSASSFVRYISFSGVEPTTITIYNTQLFTVNTTTKTKVYWPGGLTNPITIQLGVMNSSGTMYNKQGLGQATFNWDWYALPVYKNPLNEQN